MTTQTLHNYSGSGHPPVAWALAFVAMVLAAMLLGGCTEPLAPMLPEWDIDANMPLINQTWTMSDLLQEDDMLRITQNGDQLMIVTQKYPLHAISLADHLRIDDQQFRIAEHLDVIHFDIPDYLDQAMGVFTLFPGLSGGAQVVPALRNELGLGVDIDVQSYFEEMTFEKGKLILRFRNMSPVALRPEDIRLLDPSNRVIARSSYSGLVQPNATVTLPDIALDGLTLTSRMRLAFDISTPGSNGSQVAVVSSQYLGVQAEIKDSEIFSVKGFVPSQEMTQSRSIDLAGNSGLRVQSATVRSGTLSFTIANHFNLSAEIAITLRSATVGGVPLKATATVPANGNKTLSIDLTGASLSLQNETTLLYDAGVVTEDASKKTVLVKRTDSVSVTGSLNNVTFSQMTGRIAPRTLSIRRMEASDFGLDKTITGSIRLTEAKMWANLRNQAFLPVDVVNASVLGKSVTGTSSKLQVLPVDIAGRSETVVHFNDGQVVNFLNSFTPQLPDSLGLEGTFTLNPDGAYGSASSADSIVGDLYVEFPLRFTQISGSVTDTVEMIIDQDIRVKLAEINEGELMFDVENRLPTMVTIEPEFLDGNYKLLLAPVTTDGTALTVRAATIGGDGFTSRAVIEKLRMQFSGENFATVSRAAFIRFKISFNADESAATAFRSTDYVRIRGYARLNVNTSITGK